MADYIVSLHGHNKIQHHIFKDIVKYLHKGDCLVINNTKVIPARLFGSKVGTDAKIEVLLLKRKEKYKKIPKRDFLKKLPSKKGFITDNHSVIKPF